MAAFVHEDLAIDAPGKVGTCSWTLLFARQEIGGIVHEQASLPIEFATTDAWMQFVSDFTGDGWGDALNCSFTGGGCSLYVNPKGESRRWDKHLGRAGVSDRNRRHPRPAL